MNASSSSVDLGVDTSVLLLSSIAAVFVLYAAVACACVGFAEFAERRRAAARLATGEQVLGEAAGRRQLGSAWENLGAAWARALGVWSAFVAVLLPLGTRLSALLLNPVNAALLLLALPLYLYTFAYERVDPVLIVPFNGVSTLWQLLCTLANLLSVAVAGVVPLTNLFSVRLPYQLSVGLLFDVVASAVLELQTLLLIVLGTGIRFTGDASRWLAPLATDGYFSAAPDFTATGVQVGAVFEGAQLMLFNLCGPLAALTQPLADGLARGAYDDLVPLNRSSDPLPRHTSLGCAVGGLFNVTASAVTFAVNPFVLGLRSSAQHPDSLLDRYNYSRPSVDLLRDSVYSAALCTAGIGDDVVSQYVAAIINLGLSGRPQFRSALLQDMHVPRVFECFARYAWLGSPESLLTPSLFSVKALLASPEARFMGWRALFHWDSILFSWDGQQFLRLDPYVRAYRDVLECISNSVNFLGRLLLILADALDGGGQECLIVDNRFAVTSGACTLRFIAAAVELTTCVPRAFAEYVLRLQQQVAVNLPLGTLYSLGARLYVEKFAESPPVGGFCNGADIEPRWVNYCSVFRSQSWALDHLQYMWGDRRANIAGSPLQFCDYCNSPSVQECDRAGHCRDHTGAAEFATCDTQRTHRCIQDECLGNSTDGLLCHYRDAGGCGIGECTSAANSSGAVMGICALVLDRSPEQCNCVCGSNEFRLLQSELVDLVDCARDFFNLASSNTLETLGCGVTNFAKVLSESVLVVGKFVSFTDRYPPPLAQSPRDVIEPFHWNDAALRLTQCFSAPAAGGVLSLEAPLAAPSGPEAFVALLRGAIGTVVQALLDLGAKSAAVFGELTRWIRQPATAMDTLPLTRFFESLVALPFALVGALIQLFGALFALLSVEAGDAIFTVGSIIADIGPAVAAAMLPFLRFIAVCLLGVVVFFITLIVPGMEVRTDLLVACLTEILLFLLTVLEAIFGESFACWFNDAMCVFTNVDVFPGKCGADSWCGPDKNIICLANDFICRVLPVITTPAITGIPGCVYKHCNNPGISCYFKDFPDEALNVSSVDFACSELIAVRAQYGNTAPTAGFGNLANFDKCVWGYTAPAALCLDPSVRCRMPNCHDPVLLQYERGSELGCYVHYASSEPLMACSNFTRTRDICENEARSCVRAVSAAGGDFSAVASYNLSRPECCNVTNSALFNSSLVTPCFHSAFAPTNTSCFAHVPAARAQPYAYTAALHGGSTLRQLTSECFHYWSVAREDAVLAGLISGLATLYGSSRCLRHEQAMPYAGVYRHECCNLTSGGEFGLVPVRCVPPNLQDNIALFPWSDESGGCDHYYKSHLRGCWSVNNHSYAPCAIPPPGKKRQATNDDEGGAYVLNDAGTALVAAPPRADSGAARAAFYMSMQPPVLLSTTGKEDLLTRCARHALNAAASAARGSSSAQAAFAAATSDIEGQWWVESSVSSLQYACGDMMLEQPDLLRRRHLAGEPLVQGLEMFDALATRTVRTALNMLQRIITLVPSNNSDEASSMFYGVNRMLDRVLPAGGDAAHAFHAVVARHHEQEMRARAAYRAAVQRVSVLDSAEAHALFEQEAFSSQDGNFLFHLRYRLQRVFAARPALLALARHTPVHGGGGGDSTREHFLAAAAESVQLLGGGGSTPSAQRRRSSVVARHNPDRWLEASFARIRGVRRTQQQQQQHKRQASPATLPQLYAEFGASVAAALVQPPAATLALFNGTEDECRVQGPPWQCCTSQRHYCANCSYVDRVTYAAADGISLAGRFYAHDYNARFMRCAALAVATRNYAQVAQLDGSTHAGAQAAANLARLGARPPCPALLCGTPECTRDSECALSMQAPDLRGNVARRCNTRLGRCIYTGDTTLAGNATACDLLGAPCVVFDVPGPGAGLGRCSDAVRGRCGETEHSATALELCRCPDTYLTRHKRVPWLLSLDLGPWAVFNATRFWERVQPRDGSCSSGGEIAPQQITALVLYERASSGPDPFNLYTMLRATADLVNNAGSRLIDWALERWYVLAARAACAVAVGENIWREFISCDWDADYYCRLARAPDSDCCSSSCETRVQGLGLPRGVLYAGLPLLLLARLLSRYPVFGPVFAGVAVYLLWETFWPLANMIAYGGGFVCYYRGYLVLLQPVARLVYAAVMALGKVLKRRVPLCAGPARACRRFCAVTMALLAGTLFVSGVSVCMPRDAFDMLNMALPQHNFLVLAPLVDRTANNTNTPILSQPLPGLVVPLMQPLPRVHNCAERGFLAHTSFRDPLDNALYALEQGWPGANARLARSLAAVPGLGWLARRALLHTEQAHAADNARVDGVVEACNAKTSASLLVLLVLGELALLLAGAGVAAAIAALVVIVLVLYFFTLVIALSWSSAATASFGDDDDDASADKATELQPLYAKQPPVAQEAGYSMPPQQPPSLYRRKK